MSYPEPTVGAVILNPEGKILLCKSHKWENKWVIPGGHIELGEKMEDALRREIHEETGLEIYSAKLLGIKESIFSDTFHEPKHFIFIDYLCRTNSSLVTLNDEAQEYAWVKLEDIVQYELGGFTRSLLDRLHYDKSSADQVEIFYNY
jgi:nucleoside triphosphatase